MKESMIKIWVDDEREMPDNYTHLAYSTNYALQLIGDAYYYNYDLEVSLDHDAGKYVNKGGDYIIRKQTQRLFSCYRLLSHCFSPDF